MVAETGSFRAAGERLFLDASTVSKLVKRLERSLDVVLLRRTTRHVELTAAGSEAVALAQHFLAAHQALRELRLPEASEAGRAGSAAGVGGPVRAAS